MIDEFFSKKFINVRPEMMGKKEGGSKSITKDRYGNIKGKLKNYFIPFVGANTNWDQVFGGSKYRSRVWSTGAASP